MLFKDFSIFSWGGHFVQWSETVCAKLVEGIMWNIQVFLPFELGSYRHGSYMSPIVSLWWQLVPCDVMYLCKVIEKLSEVCRVHTGP